MEGFFKHKRYKRTYIYSGLLVLEKRLIQHYQCIYLPKTSNKRLLVWYTACHPFVDLLKMEVKLGSFLWKSWKHCYIITVVKIIHQLLVVYIRTTSPSHHTYTDSVRDNFWQVHVPYILQKQIYMLWDSNFFNKM